MGLKKLLKKLGHFLDDEDQVKKPDCEDIKELLEKLLKKRSKLEKKLDEETSSRQRKSLKLDLKITKAELEKGNKLYREKCR